MECFKCHNIINTYEEKESDVNLATQIVEDAYKDNCDIIIIVSADSDMIPAIELAREAGIEIGITGGIKTDNRMRTNIEHIWAAGDCTEETCLITKRPMYAALGTIANKQGRVAGINVNTDTNGVYEAFDGILGSAVTSYFDFSMSATGLTETKAKIYAKNANIEPISALVTKRDKAGYMPDSKSITVKLVADKRTGELLGAQAVGAGDADKRIYTVTSALKANLTVNEFYI